MYKAVEIVDKCLKNNRKKQEKADSRWENEGKKKKRQISKDPDGNFVPVFFAYMIYVRIPGMETVRNITFPADFPRLLRYLRRPW